MDNRVLVNGLRPKYGEKDFVHCTLQIKVDELQQWLNDHKQHASQYGFMFVDIIKSKNKEGVLYGSYFIKEKPEEVKAKDHMPDRVEVNEDGLPF